MRLALLLLVSSVPSYALAAQVEEGSRALDELTRCQTIRDDTQRLSCFDRAADRIGGAKKTGDLLVFDRTRVAKKAATRFGLADPTPGSTDQEAQNVAIRAADIKEITSTIKIVRPAVGRNRWILQLANGQTWRMLDDLNVEPRPGAPIRLSTTVTGGFRASISRGKAVQVERIG